tara:strand:- start:2242 stop:2637 length:396 start_codon:yes stop_codon:yes gene_type:complete
MRNKKIFGFFLIMLIFACKDTGENKAEMVETPSPKTNVENEIIGRWIEPNPINDSEFQGFELMRGGSANSINMQTLLYKKWYVINNKVYLVSHSIGNQKISIDTIGYDVFKLGRNDLILKRPNKTYTYSRE